MQASELFFSDDFSRDKMMVMYSVSYLQLKSYNLLQLIASFGVTRGISSSVRSTSWVDSSAAMDPQVVKVAIATELSYYIQNYRCNGRPRLGSSSDAWQEAADADNVWRCTAP
jgi:hypothetical protein